MQSNRSINALFMQIAIAFLLPHAEGCSNSPAPNRWPGVTHDGIFVVRLSEVDRKQLVVAFDEAKTIAAADPLHNQVISRLILEEPGLKDTIIDLRATTDNFFLVEYKGRTPVGIHGLIVAEAVESEIVVVRRYVFSIN